MEAVVLAIEAEDLWIGFADISPKPLWVVKGVSFVVKKGEIFCLVGESGSGKSTIGKAISGILPPYAETRGELRIFGKPAIKGNATNYNGIRGREVTYIPQNPGTALNPYYTVSEQFHAVLKSLYGFDKRKSLEIARSSLELVELDPEKVLDYYPHELSGGMQQRVAIAMAISTGAKLLVADEPTSSVDAHLRLQLVKLLKKLRDERGLTIFLITHDILNASRICDTMAIMYAGKILEMGKSGEVLSMPANPYTRMLLDAAPQLGEIKPLRAIPGEPPRPGEEIEGCVFRPRCPYADERCLRPPPGVKVDDRVVWCWKPLGKR